jgi:hypothetical protein
MTDRQTLARRYIDLWNETDARRRLTLLAESWTGDAVYADPLIQRQGYREISALIGAVQARFPGMRFALAGVAGDGDRVHVSWTLCGDTGEPVLKGTDFALLAGGHIAAVTAFLQPLCAAS